MPSEETDYTLKQEKIRRLEKKKKFFLISIVIMVLGITPGLVYQGRYVWLILILINILAGTIAFVQFTSGLKDLYKNDTASEKKEMMLFLKIFIIVMPVGTGTALIYMYYLGLLDLIF